MSAFQVESSSQFDPGSSPYGRVTRRETVVKMLRAALQSADYRFARQCALSWLAAFPGDLEISLLQAQAIIGEGKPGQVIPALELACRKDPFSEEAYRVLAQATQLSSLDQYAFALSGLFVLNGVMPERARLAEWAVPLRQAYTAFMDQKYVDAEKFVQDALRANPDLLQAAALHLLVDRATQEALTVYHLAEIYHTRWPDCLVMNLVLAEGQMELGNEPEAVRLLHLCAANDATGEVARRLWGDQHPYRSLWPEDLVMVFDQTIPAGVAVRLGWNQLPQGEVKRPEPVKETKGNILENIVGLVEEVVNPVETSIEAPEPELVEAEEPLLPVDDAVMPVDDPLDDQWVDEFTKPVPAPINHSMDLPDSLDLNLPPLASEDVVDIRSADHLDEADSTRWIAELNAALDDPKSGPRPYERKRRKARSEQTAANVATKPAPKPVQNETTRSVENELERLASKLKQPPVGRVDGRHPIYVIFTSKEGLNGQYGPQTARVLDGEMRRLAALVGQRPGWGAMVYYPDDATCTAQYGLTPVNPRDPWKLKNALSDLDGALAKRGEMIGALFIVGGDTVVPFHRLPNPTDDSDGEVPSDSPYATLDANYFVPEWPVGRITGEKGPDVVLLLEQLRAVIRQQARRRANIVFLGLDWAAAFKSLFDRLIPGAKSASFGYTAAVWRRSSLAVFRPIGAPHTVMASPPEHSGTVDGKRITGAGLGYYNLHGLADSPAWYGQRDPLDKSNTPDYPVALTPEDLHRNGHAPRVIFSEACYGGHVFGKCENESLALKFLSMGTQAVVGSTTISYGSVSTPLIAADLLGNLFWQHLKSGRPAGEALMQAKIDLVREMNRRQGFLDGEDQKTLISFVLYGDPLATYDGFRMRSKAILRSKDHPMVKVVSDIAEEGVIPPKLSSEALKQVKQIVAEYLPGADLGGMHLVRQLAPNGAVINGASAQKHAGGPGRVVVTVSKQVQTGHYIHKHFVRVTLDEGGNPVKMSISR